MTVSETHARAESSLEGDTLVVTLGGQWQITGERPSWKRVAADARPRRVRLDGSGVETWDSSLALFVNEARRWCVDFGAEFVVGGMPHGSEKLADLLVREAPSEMEQPPRASLAAVIGAATVAGWEEAKDIARLIGECAFSIGRFIRGQAQFRWRDCLAEMQACGVMALPIVSLISFLVGVILAYQGAVQLRQFGADIYVADMVGLAVVREMGPLMMAIVLAGRTGAAFAATIGNMKANEEIDALVTLGVSPVDFLVMPRITALFLMMPLLAIYADCLGILGGMAIAQVILDIPPTAYWVETTSWVDLSDVSTGLIKAATFGLLVGVAGCLRGMQAERSAVGVGRAATQAVVSGILLIIVADAVFAVVFNILGW